MRYSPKAALFALLLLGLLAVAGCGDQNIRTKQYEMMKDEIKTELKAELIDELGSAIQAAPSSAPAPAAEEEEDDEDKFGC